MAKDEIQQTGCASDVDDLGPEKAAYRDADKALEFLKFNETGDERDVVDEKKLAKRIDWMIVPIMFACYFLQYLDKSLRKSILDNILLWTNIEESITRPLWVSLRTHTSPLNNMETSPGYSTWLF